MSHLDDRFATNHITVWQLLDRDQNGRPIYELRAIYGSTWKSGQGIMKDSDGTEFVPKDVYYPVSGAVIERGDIVAQGMHPGGDPNEIGDVVRMVDTDDQSYFGWTNSISFMTASR